MISAFLSLILLQITFFNPFYATMKTLFIFLCLPAFLFLTSACQNKAQQTSSEAILRWTGMIAADGCGYFLDIGDKEYKAVNEEVIPESFQQNERSAVRVTFEYLAEPLEYSCGLMPLRYISSIRILNIQKID
jgi:hypothetical protein